MTKGDFFRVVELLREWKTFPDDAELRPDDASEGGIAIYSGWFQRKSVRFWRSDNSREAFAGFESNNDWLDKMSSWRNNPEKIAEWPVREEVAHLKRSHKMRFECKSVEGGAGPWTADELLCVKNALLLTGAFKE